MTYYNIIIICLSSLFTFYIAFNRTKERPGNIYIGFFVLFFALESLDVILGKTTFYTDYPYLYLIIPALAFLIYPSWFFYIKITAFKDYELKKKDLLHLLPFVIMSVIFIFNYHIQSNEIKIEIKNNKGTMLWFIGLSYYVLRIQGVIYAILSIKVIYRFKKIVKEHYSNISKKNYKWILQLTFVFIYFIVVTLIFNIIRFGFSDLYSEQDIPHHISSILTLIFLSWIIYKGMSQPYLFNGIDSNIKLLKEYIKEEKENEQQAKSDKTVSAQSLALKNKIESYVASNEVYRNPSITVFELAKGLNLTSRELSLFLNKNLNKNFFDFINEYRIKNAMEILEDPTKSDLTILEILYQVGFNSKSSFNTAFKKHTNLTPTQYRKIHIIS